MADAGGSRSPSVELLWLSSPYTLPYHDTSDDDEDTSAVENLNQTLDLIGLGSSDHSHAGGRSPAFEPKENESSAVFERHMIDVYGQLHDDNLPPIISSVSPSGHHLEFYAETKEEDTLFGDQPSIWSDMGTVLGQTAALIRMDEAHSFLNKRVQQQAKDGIVQLNKVTTIPLSAFWHRFTQAAGIIVFMTNVCVALADIFITDADGNYTNLHYKVPAFVMGIIENIALVLWFLCQLKGDNEKNIKHQQYVENILHEVLLYPLIVLSVFSFANDKMYTMADSFFGWLQVVLMAIDAFDMMWTQIIRVFMLRTFVRDVEGFLGPSVNIGGHVLRRGLVTAVTNVVVFMFVILMLGAQVHDDNYDSGVYGASMRSVILTVAVMTMPLFNLLMFVIVNVQWLVELLLLLGSRSQTEDLVSIKKTELGAMTTEAASMAYASDDVKKKLNGVRNVHPFKKFICVAIEPRLAALIFLWQILSLLAVITFDGCKNISICNGYNVQWTFAIVVVAANIHLVIVVVSFNIILFVVVVAMFLYPLTIPLLLR